MRMDKDPKFIRFPESLWAFVTIFPSDLIEKHGVEHFFNSGYLWIYSILGAILFGISMIMGEKAVSPWMHRVRSIFLFAATIAITAFFPSLVGRIVVAFLAICYFFWPNNHIAFRRAAA